MLGCATPLPPTYGTTGSDRALDGPILALGGEDDIVAAVSAEGLFVKKGDGPWVSQEAPGIRTWSRVTCVAVSKGIIYLGSDGEGLHILREGAWEVRTSRYGGLPDDGVLSIAVNDPDGGGLFGTAVWVGSRKGITTLRGDEWSLYQPDGQWLVALTGKSGSGAGKVYVGSGFRLGKKGEDSDRFRPPVSAIWAGSGRVVFGNPDSSLAVVSEDGVATFKFNDDVKIRHLRVDPNVIWAGTDTGLLWGGLKGGAPGKPWPTNRAYLGWSGTLFGSRDTRDFEYRWKPVGYNTAMIVGLEKRGPDVWVAHRSTGGARKAMGMSENIGTEQFVIEPITDTRRYVNIEEYIARKQKIQYESYGLSAGIKGDPTALYVAPDGARVWVGTTKGLWELNSD